MYKVCLINLFKDREDFENLGLESINSYLRTNGIDSEILNVFVGDDIELNMISKYDMYAFSLYHNSADYVYSIAKKIKNQWPEKIICCGSKFSSNAFREILDECRYIDFIIIGDGEEPLLNAINNICNGDNLEEVESIKTRKNIDKPTIVNQSNLSELPKPTREIISNNKNLLVARISTSRGCCANCSFCSVNNLGGKKWIGRDIDDVVKEIVDIYISTGISSFIFCDGSFEDPGELGKERIKYFCEKISELEYKFSFRCFLRAETFTENDHNLINLMKKTGFTIVYIGVEAGNEYDLEIYKKKASIDDNYKSLKIFNDSGIKVLMGFLMFNPFSNAITLKSNYNFLCSVRDSRLYHYVSKVEIYYNTQLYHEAQNSGLLGAKYSYKNPDKYLFNDDFTSACWETISKNIMNSDIMYYDNMYYNFVHIIGYLKAMYPSEICKYEDEYQVIDNRIFEIIRDYFKILYVNGDFSEFEHTYQSFYKSLVSEYKKIETLKLKLIKNKLFRTLFIRK